MSPVGARRLKELKTQAGSGTEATSGSVERLAPAAPAPIDGFDGIANQGGAGFQPSDTHGALGDSSYVVVANSVVSVYDLSGAKDGSFPVRLRAFANLPSGAFDFDPKVVYDQYRDQFILVFLALDRGNNPSKSWITFATVPDGQAGQPGQWCITRINGDQIPRDGSQWADYPGLGYTANRVTVTTNQFNLGSSGPGFFYSQIVSVTASSLFDCGKKLSAKVFAGRATRDPDGSKAFTIQPAQTYGGTNPTDQFLLSFDWGGNGAGTKVVLWRLRKTGTGLRLAKAGKKVGKAKIAPFGSQKGGTGNDFLWDNGDLRLINAAYDADVGRLYAGHTIARQLGDAGHLESVARWYELAPAGSLKNSTVPRRGIIGEEDRDVGYPTMATDDAGRLFVTYSQAGSQGGGGEFLSAYVATIPSVGTTATSLLLKAGEATYDAGPGVERWGDYNGINRNPADGSEVATVNQYALDTGGGPTDRWQQWVALVTDM